ncbi:hypothetical protein SAMN05428642_1021010 [Flaviramulus basaltis]|uniref:Uncharacterized protein n=1 Tax=Flaviramulus basaltis TaxID=369401 RepID=A0A1K2IKR4_9FLAO|nr:hypothetical protein SAMN05428642_1021010 [Flaviramulus basaltis]
MLYVKEKTEKTKRDYSYLHLSPTSKKVKKNKKKVRVTLSGKPK